MIKNRLKNLKYTYTGIQAKQIVILNVIVGKFLLRTLSSKTRECKFKICMYEKKIINHIIK